MRKEDNIEAEDENEEENDDEQGKGGVEVEELSALVCGGLVNDGVESVTDKELGTLVVLVGKETDVDSICLVVDVTAFRFFLCVSSSWGSDTDSYKFTR